MSEIIRMICGSIRAILFIYSDYVHILFDSLYSMLFHVIPMFPVDPGLFPMVLSPWLRHLAHELSMLVPGRCCCRWLKTAERHWVMTIVSPCPDFRNLSWLVMLYSNISARQPPKWCRKVVPRSEIYPRWYWYIWLTEYHDAMYQDQIYRGYRQQKGGEMGNITNKHGSLTAVNGYNLNILYSVTKPIQFTMGWWIERNFWNKKIHDG